MQKNRIPDEIWKLLEPSILKNLSSQFRHEQKYKPLLSLVKGD